MQSLPDGAPAAHADLKEALELLPGPAGSPFATIFRHGTLTVELYAPRGRDAQTPHARDEVYVVASGSGTFFDGEKRRSFAPGSFLFVRAWREHRFEDFTDDFSAWVLFYGPEGGERPAPPGSGAPEPPDRAAR